MPRRLLYPHTKKEIENMVEKKLMTLAYRKVRSHKWIRGNRVVRTVHSPEFERNYIRIWWREEWKDDHAVVYDYTGVWGPVCVVSVPDLFMSDFVKEKGRKIHTQMADIGGRRTSP